MKLNLTNWYVPSFFSWFAWFFSTFLSCCCSSWPHLSCSVPMSPTPTRCHPLTVVGIELSNVRILEFSQMTSLLHAETSVKPAALAVITPLFTVIFNLSGYFCACYSWCQLQLHHISLHRGYQRFYCLRCPLLAASNLNVSGIIALVKPTCRHVSQSWYSSFSFSLFDASSGMLFVYWYLGGTSVRFNPLSSSTSHLLPYSLEQRNFGWT